LRWMSVRTNDTWHESAHVRLTALTSVLPAIYPLKLRQNPQGRATPIFRRPDDRHIFPGWKCYAHNFVRSRNKNKSASRRGKSVATGPDGSAVIPGQFKKRPLKGARMTYDACAGRRRVCVRSPL